MIRRRVLVVDDDEHVCELVSIVFNAEDFVVEAAFDGQTGLEKVLHGDYDAVILDIMMPGIDGLEICRRIRSSLKRGVPVIMLSAKGEEIDRILGLELGADDYITKPFSPRELLARVKALLRRSAQYNEAHSAAFSVGDLVINIDSYKVLVGEKELELTPKEFELLAFLARHIGRIFSREVLLQRVWGYDYPGGTRTIDEHIKRLRRKLGKNDRRHTYIQTVWGVGYKIEVKKR